MLRFHPPYNFISPHRYTNWSNFWTEEADLCTVWCDGSPKNLFSFFL